MIPTVHTLKVTLRGLRPPIWRRIEVASDVTLAELSSLLEAAMGWFGGHLHGFDVDGVIYQPSPLDGPSFVDTRNEADHRLSEVLPTIKSKMRWDYDFGDGWQHNVVVEAIEPADDTVDYPRCIGGRRACPPEDCGGVWGFGDLLDAIDDPAHPRHDELNDWLPLGYDPTHFDADEVTEDMHAPRPLLDW